MSTEQNKGTMSTVSDIASRNTAEQVQWLVDRALIHDLIVEYARTADEKDWEASPQLFADEGSIEMPFGSIPRAEVASQAERVLRPFPVTHHFMGNMAIHIDGDRATSRHYLTATHVVAGGAPDRHADVGGWYDATYRRTEEGWKFVTVRLSFLWTDGVPFQPGT